MSYCPRVFCIGRNYAEHARELGNAVPSRPVVFMKPVSCIVAPGVPIRLPTHGADLQHEVEVVVRIGTTGRPGSEQEARAFVDAVTVGLDLTLRDVQDALKAKGLPWEIAKAFEQSSPLGDFTACDSRRDLADVTFGCRVNGQIRQTGNTGGMLFSVPRLIMELATVWELRPGDMVYTGTPPGVGPLRAGDRIEIQGDGIGTFSWSIV